MKHCFMVSSAINTTIGEFSNEERLEQTLDTIKSIKTKVPDAVIIIVECSSITLTPEQRNILDINCDMLVTYDSDPHVKDMYEKNIALGNWDIVKSYTEIYCFLGVFKLCLEKDYFSGIDRIHKMSGRYILNDEFDATGYEDPEFSGKIIISKRYYSQFKPELVDNIPYCYMTRLWSWPTVITRQIQQSYHNSLMFLRSIGKSGKTKLDIEHLLYRFLPSDLVVSVQELGVEGSISTIPDKKGKIND